MNDFVIHDSSEHAVFTPAVAPVLIVPVEQPTEPVRVIPVEDFGLGLVRLVKDGINGAAALGDVEALKSSVKSVTVLAQSATNQVVNGANALVAKASGLVKRKAAADPEVAVE